VSVPIFSPVFRHAEAAPDKVAAASPRAALSYGGLAQAAALLIRAMPAPDRRSERAGIPGGNRIVAVSLRNGIGFFPVLLAATAPATVMALIPPSLPERAVRRLLDRLRPDCLFIDRDRACGAFGDGVPIFAVDSETGVNASLDRMDTVDTMVPRTCDSGPKPQERGRDADPDSPFLIGLTSGSSGDPKAFYRSRESWRRSLEQHENTFGLTARDCVLAPGPLSHGLTLYAAAEALYAGAGFRFLERFDAAAALKMLAAEPVTRLTLVPAMLHDILDRAGTARFSSVTMIVSAGAKLPALLRERARAAFPAAKILEYYGASELSFVTLADGSAPPASVGRAFPGVHVSIRDATGGREVPDREIGTLFVDSPLVSNGYCFDDAGTGFTRTGRWAGVGDRAWRDAEGFFYLAGRQGEGINSGGNSFYPEEVEAVLAEHRLVDAVCVLGLDDARLSQVAVAVIESRGAPALADLQACCAERLPRYKTPRRFFVLVGMPRTESGKIDRAALAGMIAAGSSDLKEL